MQFLFASFTTHAKLTLSGTWLDLTILDVRSNLQHCGGSSKKSGYLGYLGYLGLSGRCFSSALVYMFHVTVKNLLIVARLLMIECVQ